MIRTRRQVSFQDPVDLPHTDGLETVFETYEPTHDDIKNTHITIKSPANSHLSTELIMERTFTVDILQNVVGSKSHHVPGAAFYNFFPELNSPGFSLMNNCKRAAFIFESATVHSRPSDWLPCYSECYRHSLRNVVRGSGRSFADRRIRGLGQSYDSIEDRLLTEHDFRYDGGEAFIEQIQNFHPYYEGGLSFFAWHGDAFVTRWQADQHFDELHEFPDDDDPNASNYFVDWGHFINKYTTHDQVNDFNDGDKIMDGWEILIQHDIDGNGIPTINQINTWAAQIAFGEDPANRPLDENQQDAYLEAKELHSNWHAAEPYWAPMRDAMIRAYEEATYDRHPHAWLATRMVLGAIDVVPFTRTDLNGEPLLDANGLPLLMIPGPNGDILVDRDRMSRLNVFAHTFLSIINGEPPFDGADGNEPALTTPAREHSMILAWAAEFSTVKPADDHMLAQLNLVRHGNFDLLRKLFYTAMHTGANIKSLHVMLNEMMHVGMSDEDIHEKFDTHEELFTEAARTACNYSHGTSQQTPFWKQIGERYRGLYFALQEVETAIHDLEVDEDDDLQYLQLNSLPKSQARIRFVEPLAIGFCKPSPHLDVGCWAKAGELIPRLKTMTIDFEWCDDMEERMFNLFRMRNYYSKKLHGDVDFQLRIVGVDTKLHCTHYRGELPGPVKLGIPDIESHVIGACVFPKDHSAEYENTIRFDFPYRGNPEPKFVCFFARRNFSTVTHQYKRTYNDGPAIIKLKLGINTQVNALRLDTADHRCRFNALTQECFPEFKAPIDEHGSFFAFPYSKLFHSNFEERHGSRMFGEITLRMRPYETFARYNFAGGDAFDLICMFIYEGRFLELGVNAQHAGRTML